jgi:hypothetical protein
MGARKVCKWRQKGAFGFAALIFLSALFARPLGPDLAEEGQRGKGRRDFEWEILQVALLIAGRVNAPFHLHYFQSQRLLIVNELDLLG